MRSIAVKRISNTIAIFNIQQSTFPLSQLLLVTVISSILRPPLAASSWHGIQAHKDKSKFTNIAR